MDLFLGQLQSVSGVNIRCALLAVPVRIGCPKAVGLLVLLIAELSNLIEISIRYLLTFRNTVVNSLKGACGSFGSVSWQWGMPRCPHPGPSSLYGMLMSPSAAAHDQDGARYLLGRVLSRALSVDQRR